MKDHIYTATAKLTAAQRSAIRAHAQDFARHHDLDVNVQDLEWGDLALLKADARRSARDIAGEVRDTTPETVARAIEAAQDALLALIDMIEQEMDGRTARGNKAPSSALDARTAAPVEAKTSRSHEADPAAYALETRQSMRQWAQTRSADDFRGVSVGSYLKAMVTGASNDQEARALAAGSDSSGGYTVPQILSADLIDALRAESVVIRAGARTVPLTSDSNGIAAVASDPTPAWRAENSEVAESEPSFRLVELKPKSLAVLTRVSFELFEDTLNLQTQLPRILAAALAVELDRVALIGSGSGQEPRGIANTAGIGQIEHDALLAGYAPLVRARTSILKANAGPVSAMIMSPRDEGTLVGLTDSTGQPLDAPRALAEIPMLTTTSLPVDLGTGDDESLIIAGNFRHLLLGMRSTIKVEVLRERFADRMQYGLLAHLRADVAVEHASAFTAITGVKEPT